MTWVLVALLALASFAAAAFPFKAPRKGWEAIGASESAIDWPWHCRQRSVSISALARASLAGSSSWR